MRSLHHAPIDNPSGAPQDPEATRDPFSLDPASTLALALEEARAAVATGMIETINNPGRLDSKTLHDIESLEKAGQTLTVEIEAIPEGDEELPAEKAQVGDAIKHAPLTHALSEETKNVLAVHASELTLEIGDYLKSNGLYIAQGSGGANLAVMNTDGTFTGIIWKITQHAHVGEFTLAFDLPSNLRLAVIGAPTQFIYIDPAEITDDLTPSDQNEIQISAILSAARKLNETNKSLRTDQENVAQKGGSINLPTYTGTTIPDWFEAVSKEQIFAPQATIPLYPGDHNILVSGRALVKDPTGKHTLARLGRDARFGEIMTVTPQESEAQPTGSIVADTKVTIKTAPLLAQDHPHYPAQLRDLGHSLIKKLEGVIADRATLKGMVR